MDLLSVVLDLKPALPSAEAGDRPVPQWWGRAAQALFLRVVQASQPDLANALHEADQRRPFTVSTLMGRLPNGQLDPQGSYRLRFTTLTAEVSAVLMAAIQPGGMLAPAASAELDYVLFRVEQVRLDEDDLCWSAQADYQTLSAAHLLADHAPARRVGLKFTSPTVFKMQSRQRPLPLPERVFGSLLKCWNTFAPLALPKEVVRYARECLAVSNFNLRSRLAGTKGEGLRSGTVGTITYVSLNYDRYWMSLIQALAAYALYAGVGAGTAMGMGQCCQLDARKHSADR